MGWAGHVARTRDERKVCNVLVGKPDEVPEACHLQCEVSPCVTCEHPVLAYIKPYHQYFYRVHPVV